MATIRDVANRAGVSVATVSHVINESRFVMPETKLRVLEAISDLRYSRDEVARSLRRSKTGTIGVIISAITNPFFADLVRGIEDEVYLRSEKINYILCNTEEDVAKERLYLDVVREKRLDGLIIAPVGGNEDYLSDLVAQDFPIVLVDRTSPHVRADTILVDNEAASYKMTRHLLELGHRRISFFKAILNADSIEDRLKGYKTALHEAGIPFSPSLVVESPSDIEEATTVASATILADRPDAVFCSNNFITIGLMRAINKAGLICPQDIAVASFDDFPWADAFRPRLTTVAQPSFAMGQAAVRALIARMNDREPREPTRVVLPTELHIRESCGADADRP